MTRRAHIQFVVAAAVLAAIVCAHAAEVPRYVDRDRLMRDVTQLSSPEFEGRRTSTPGGLKARRWIVDRFKELRLKPAGSAEYLHPFSFQTTSRGVTTDYPDAANVVGRIDGSQAGARPIVISAHYDHLGVRNGAIYRGADDDASGVAGLLAVARYLMAHRPRHPILLAAFDAEELGQRGSKLFVEQRADARNALMDISLDMLSRNERNEIVACGTYHYPQFKPWIEDVQTRSAVSIVFGHDRPKAIAEGVQDWTDSSDHSAFHHAGVPFIYFGVEDHADYHKPTDTADKINPAFFGAVVDMVVEAVRTFDARLP